MLQRLEFPSLPKTTEAGSNFIKVIDQQIDEVAAQLANLQALRRSAAELFGVDRRIDVGKIGTAADAANRAQYEGDESSVLRQVGGARS